MTMHTVGWALTWEYWRRGTLWIVVAIAALISACTCLLYGRSFMLQAFTIPISIRNLIRGSWRSCSATPWSW